jgi:hypothetical protein
MTHFSDADGMRLGQEGIEHQQLVFTETIQNLPAKLHSVIVLPFCVIISIYSQTLYVAASCFTAVHLTILPIRLITGT